MNIERELPPDYSYEEIVANINMLKYKLEVCLRYFIKVRYSFVRKLMNLYIKHPGSEIDANLYGSLRQALEHINPSELTWQDPEANMILSDDSGLIKNLGRRQKKVFLEPRENMKCDIPESVTRRCDEFVDRFNNSNTSQATRNIFHNKKWKESEHKLVETSERILGAL